MDIERARNMEKYLDAWKSAMQDSYWWNEDIPTVYCPAEEIAEIQDSFQKDNFGFLIAHDDKKPVGVLGYSIKEKSMRLRNWEPAILPEYRSSNVADALLDRAIEDAKNKDVKIIRAYVKTPFEDQDDGNFLRSLFKKHGFIKDEASTSVLLFTDLEEWKNRSKQPIGAELKDARYFRNEELAEFIVKSFSTTEEDLEMHDWDRAVTTYNGALKSVNHILGGGLGPAPREFWKVVFIRGEVAGIVGGSVLDRGYQLATAVLGPVGIIPHARGKGIAYFTVSAVIEEFKKYGCRYALVGTGATNEKAIKLYKKCRMKLSTHQQWYQKQL